jgi:hypothetical protein
MVFFFFCQEYEKCDRFRLWTKCNGSLYPLEKCGPISHSEGHLQVLTSYAIDRGSINKRFDRSLQPLCRCIIQLEAIVIDRNFGYEKT